MNDNRNVCNSRVSLKSIKEASFGQIVCRVSLFAEKSDSSVWRSGFLSRIFRPPKLLSSPVIRKLVCRTLDPVDGIKLFGMGGESRN